MNPVDAFHSALEALRRNPMRTLLTTLGLVIGTAAVIALIAVGDGARERLMAQIRNLGSNLIVITPGSRTVGAARLATGSRQNLTVEDAAAIAQEIPSLELAVPVVHGAAQVVAGNANWAATVVGADQDFLRAREWPIADGRGFLPEETEGADKAVILGRTVAEKLFGSANDAVGQTVRVQRVPLSVVGVLARKGQDMQGSDQDNLIVVPLSTAKARILGANHASAHAVTLIVVKARVGERLADAEQQIRDLLRQRHQRGADQADDVTIQNYAAIIAQQDASAQTLTYLLAAVAGVSLLVGGIGIMNIMLVSVTERTREIGLRLALGARRRDIVMQFLVEAATLSGIGAIVGIALGITAAVLLAGTAGWPIVIRSAAVGMSVACSVGIGIFFGLYPARSAAKLQPALALRHE